MYRRGGVVVVRRWRCSYVRGWVGMLGFRCRLMLVLYHPVVYYIHHAPCLYCTTLCLTGWPHK